MKFKVREFIDENELYDYKMDIVKCDDNIYKSPEYVCISFSRYVNTDDRMVIVCDYHVNCDDFENCNCYNNVDYNDWIVVKNIN